MMAAVAGASVWYTPLSWATGGGVIVNLSLVHNMGDSDGLYYAG